MFTFFYILVVLSMYKLLFEILFLNIVLLRIAIMFTSDRGLLILVKLGFIVY